MSYITLGNLTRFLNKLKTYIGNNYLNLTGGRVTGNVSFSRDIEANRVRLRNVAKPITLISNGDGNMAKEQDGKFYAFLDEKNYAEYVPKLDGTGATGTWDINISGNALNDSEGNKIVDTYAKKSDIPTGSNITVDSALSDTSTNPVQNRIIKYNLDNKWDVNSETLEITTAQGYPLKIISTEDSRFSAGLGSSGMYISNADGEITATPQRIKFKNKNSTYMYIAPLLDGSGTVQISLTNVYGTITSTKNIATEDYVRTNYVPLSNGHISINGSELWIE